MSYISSSIIANQTTRTPMILGQSQLMPNSGANIKRKATGLIITSLVDIFSVLVIYLLFGPAFNGESIDSQLGVKLPIAYQSQLTDNENVLVIKNNQFILNQKEINERQLASELKMSAKNLAGNKKNSLVIIADQSYDVDKLNPVLIAASEAGLNQLRLAVEHQGE